MIADYQPLAAKVAFAAGAGLILGHHAHVPKAIGVHDSKVCFYSLSNFIMSGTEKSAGEAQKFEREFSVERDPGYPRLPYGSDVKRSLIARAVLSRGGAERVFFLPVLVDPELCPEVLRNGDPRFNDAVNFMERVSEDFPHRFTVDDNEVVVGV